MVSFREKNGYGRKPRLKNLQQAQEEIYRLLHLLIPDDVAICDRFKSRVAGSPLLHLEILERHPYTSFLRLTYLFDTGGEQRVAPDAHIRMYQDARMAEVTAFNAEQGIRRTAHPWYPHRPLIQRLWRENVALEKWLSYLLSQGHSCETMRPSDIAIGEAKRDRLPVPAG